MSGFASSNISSNKNGGEQVCMSGKKRKNGGEQVCMF